MKYMKRRERDIQEKERDGRTSIWDNKTSYGISPIHDEGNIPSRSGMGFSEIRNCPTIKCSTFYCYCLRNKEIT
jgi:hypothetical protein